MNQRYLTKQEAQIEAERLHKRFVDSMHPEFAHHQNPGYAIIEPKPLLRNGIFVFMLPPERSRIYLRANKNGKDLHIPESEYLGFMFTCLHESAHHLHKKLLQWHIRARSQGKKEISQEQEWFSQDLADYATLIFMKENYIDFLQQAIDYAERDSIAVKLFNSDSGLLRRLSTSEVEEARELILEKIEIDINKIE